MKTYEATTEWLFNQFPAYQNLGAGAYKPDLYNIEKLLHALNNPHKQLNCIHIAGTNGKGSTSHILSSILQSAGYKVGLFTSPHLVDFRERIKVNGEYISEEKVIHWVNEVIPQLNIDYSPSFFELTFAMAVDHFKTEECDFCIIEVGLGGRLDATNCINPLISVITNIGLDHQQFLGETRSLIAAEKAGIIKDEVPVVICEKDDETQSVFETTARKRKAPLIWVKPTPIKTDLIGVYQQYNANTANTVIHVLKEMKVVQVNEQQLEQGLMHVKQNTKFMGRMDVLSKAPLTVIDGAHNKEGVKALLDNFSDSKHTLHIVYGASNDKNIEEVITLFPKNAIVYFTEFNHQRSFKVEDLQKRTEKITHKSNYFSDSKLALKNAQLTAKKEDTILIFGSLFLISEFF